MKKLAILLSLSFYASFASNIDELVQKAYINNQNLKSMEEAITIASFNISLAKKWKDPVLSFGVNDIQFSQVLKRDLEPMQTQFIGISQVIPMGNKLEIKEKIAVKDKSIVFFSLEEKKLKLKAKIYEISFNILLLKEKIQLLNAYELNINKLNKLLQDLYKFDKSNQNEVLDIDISLVNLQIKKQNLQNMIDNLYLKLEQITYEKNASISKSLNLKKLVLNMDVSTHPLLNIISLQGKKFDDLANLEKENEYSDIKVNIAYFNRDNKFEDYGNISVSIPLSIYKSQKLRALKAKNQVKKMKLSKKDLKQKLQLELRALENNANLAYKNYKLIKTKIIPLKEKIQKNIENYNAYSQIKPQMAIKNLNKLISFELKALDEKIKYYSNYSKSKYYITKVK